MRRYMAAHAYSNSTTADLWAALEAASGKPVAKIAAGFTEQPGVPLVKMTTKCLGESGTEVTLTQDRFTINDPKAAKLTWEQAVATLLADPQQASLARDCYFDGTPVDAVQARAIIAERYKIPPEARRRSMTSQLV